VRVAGGGTSGSSALPALSGPLMRIGCPVMSSKFVSEAGGAGTGTGAGAGGGVTAFGGVKPNWSIGRWSARGAAVAGAARCSAASGSSAEAVLGCSSGSASGDSASGSPPIPPPAPPPAPPMPPNSSSMPEALPCAGTPRSEKSSSAPSPAAGADEGEGAGPSKLANGSTLSACALREPLCIGSGNSSESGDAAAGAGAPARDVCDEAGAAGGDSPASRSAKGSSLVGPAAGAASGAPITVSGMRGAGDRSGAAAAAFARTASSKLPMTSRAPSASAASLPEPSDTPLHCIALLPRSMTKYCPSRHSTCACTRDTVRSGSSSTSVLVSARPMVPPSGPKSAAMACPAGAPCRVMTAIWIMNRPPKALCLNAPEQTRKEYSFRGACWQSRLKRYAIAARRRRR
jgi:hypothetical protein